MTALLLSVLMGIAACGGTQTCRVTGLTAGRTYLFAYENGSGNTVAGQFYAPSTTYDLTGVDSSVDCGSIDILLKDLPEEPLVAWSIHSDSFSIDVGSSDGRM